MTKIVIGILLLLPEPVLFGGGWLLLLSGAGVFVSGMFAKKNDTGKFRANLGLCAAVFGLAMILCPNYPFLAFILLLLLVAALTWKFFGAIYFYIFS